MTVANNKNGLSPVPETTKSKSTSKSHNPTKQFTKHWKFVWQSYACIEQHGRAVPMEEKETLFSLKPSQSQIDQLRKHAHAKGFKLVAIKPCCVVEDEF
jgi:hypothetical protein